MLLQTELRPEGGEGRSLGGRDCRGNSQCKDSETNSVWRITAIREGKLAQEPLGLVLGQEVEVGLGKFVILS